MTAMEQHFFRRPSLSYNLILYKPYWLAGFPGEEDVV